MEIRNNETGVRGDVVDGDCDSWVGGGVCVTSHATSTARCGSGSETPSPSFDLDTPYLSTEMADCDCAEWGMGGVSHSRRGYRTILYLHVQR